MIVVNIKKNIKKYWILLLYLIIQLFLYIVSIFIDINIKVKYLYYLFIIINFLFSCFWKTKKEDYFIMTLALFFTLIADTFLVLIGSYKELAMISFNIVQLLYFYRIYRFRDSDKKLLEVDFFRMIVMIIIYLCAIIILQNKFDLLVFLVVMYFTNLVFNFLESLKYLNKSISFTLGLFLFICCDIFIGLSNSSDYFVVKQGTLIYELLNVGIDLGWLFYFPSQILIVFSIVEINEIRKKRELNVKNDKLLGDGRA